MAPLATNGVWMRMNLGSSRKLPLRPSGALALACPLNCTDSLPETSMKPPLPPLAPPRASTLPANRVLPSAHNTA